MILRQCEWVKTRRGSGEAEAFEICHTDLAVARGKPLVLLLAVFGRGGKSS